MSLERIALLLEDYVDGNLDDERAEELLAAITADDEAGRALREELAMIGLLGQAADPVDSRGFLMSLKERARAEDDATKFVREAARRRAKTSERHSTTRRTSVVMRAVARTSTRYYVIAGSIAAAAVVLLAARLIWSSSAEAPHVSPPDLETWSAQAPRAEAPSADTERVARDSNEGSLVPPKQERAAARPGRGERGRSAAPPRRARTAEAARSRIPRPEEAALRTAGGAPLGYLDRSEGDIEIRAVAASDWSSALAGAPVERGSTLRTKLSCARIVLETGTIVYVNQWTTATFGMADGRHDVELLGGEVYVVTKPRDAGFRVRSPHGTVVDLGTRFGVDAKRISSSVYVLEGHAVASTDAGSAELKAERIVQLVKRTSPPGPVQRLTDATERIAWVAPLQSVASLRAGAPAEPQVIFASGESGNATYHFASMVAAPNGTLVAAASGRKARGKLGSWPRATCSVYARRSRDAGRTWSPAVALSPRGVGQAYRPAMLVDRTSGRVCAAFARASRGRTIMVSHSDDSGRSWSMPRALPAMSRSLGTQVRTVSPSGIQIAGGAYAGRLVFTAWGVVGKAHRTTFAYSDDGGDTWRWASGMGSIDVLDCQLVEVSPGRVIAFSRYGRAARGRGVRDFAYAAVSTDGCSTWTALGAGQDVAPPNVLVGLRSYRSAEAPDVFTILMAGGLDLERPKDLQIWLSRDSCLHWTVRRTLHATKHAYGARPAALAILPDGRVAAAFADSLRGNVLFTTFAQQWLMGGGR